MDMILGLPDILDHFLSVLVVVLETARRKRQNTTKSINGIYIMGSPERDWWTVLRHWTAYWKIIQT